MIQIPWLGVHSQHNQLLGLLSVETTNEVHNAHSGSIFVTLIGIMETPVPYSCAELEHLFCIHLLKKYWLVVCFRFTKCITKLCAQ